MDDAETVRANRRISTPCGAECEYANETCSGEVDCVDEEYWTNEDGSEDSRCVHLCVKHKDDLAPYRQYRQYMASGVKAEGMSYSKWVAWFEAGLLMNSMDGARK